MGIETQPGDVYRLIVALDGRVLVAADGRFARFEQAQTRVAETICRYAQTERVRAVVLQRGRPNVPVRRGHNGYPTRPTVADSDYDWTIEKHWDTSVIRRILLQNGIEPPATTTSPQADADTAPAPPAQPASPRRSSRPRPGGRHKSTRWHVTLTVVIVILAMIALILVQTGGHPARFLSAFMSDKPTVKNELPFDARTSFAPEPRPGGAYEPVGQPESEDSRPD